jgi:hypothetical protein
LFFFITIAAAFGNILCWEGAPRHRGPRKAIIKFTKKISEKYNLSERVSP